MPIESHGHEHELEPEHGLPERLPQGEKILWQGAPDFAAVALRIFHVRKAALYFAVILALRGGLVLADGGGLEQALLALALPLPLALVALAALLALAWMTARTAVYTLTDKRVVLRIGIVLTLTFNIPLRSIASAALRDGSKGCGDIVMQLAGPDHIAFLHLWPHVRPWRVARPEPMLRAVNGAAQVAALLAQAWSASVAAPAQPPRRAAATPVLPPVGAGAAAADTADTADGRISGPWQPSLT